MTSIYSAIMQAADAVEYSGRYEFTACLVRDCGSPMCMLGWIGHFLGFPQRAHINDVAVRLGHPCDAPFYRALTDCLPDYGTHPDSYTTEPTMAARLMRLYAEKYHGHEKPTQRPTSELVADLMGAIWEQAKKSHETELARAEWERS